MATETPNDSEILTMFGSNLKHCREKRGVTEQMMAKRLKMTVSYYKRIERGELNIRLTTLVKIIKIMRAIRIRPSELFNPN